MRDAKGTHDRYTFLPASLVEPLKAGIAFVKQQHERDLANGYGSVELLYALARKYSNADKELSWQYVFPSDRLSTDPRSGITRHHNVDPIGLQRAGKTAAKLAQMNKPVSPYTFRLPTFASPKPVLWVVCPGHICSQLEDAIIKPYLIRHGFSF